MNKKVKSLLKHLAGDSLLVSSPINIFYLTGYDGFSKEEREAYLLITKQNNYIFTDGRYKEAVKKSIRDFKLIEKPAGSGFYNEIKTIVDKQNLKRLMVSENDLSLKEYKQFKKIARIYSDENIIEKLREVKTPQEIKNIKSAAKLGDLVFEYVLTQLKTGISELQLSKKIEIFILQKNASVSFSPIVAFGNNSSVPHHVPTNKKLILNQIVLLDFGVKINGYCSDMTRTVFFGKADSEFKRMYKTVLEAQSKAIDYLKSSIINHKSLYAKGVDKVARDYIINEGFPPIPHSLGHGVGLEIHEGPRLSPISKSVLTTSNVFSIEPGIYLPNFGGIRIEVLIALTEKGPLLISNANRGIIEVNA